MTSSFSINMSVNDQPHLNSLRKTIHDRNLKNFGYDHSLQLLSFEDENGCKYFMSQLNPTAEDFANIVMGTMEAGDDFMKDFVLKYIERVRTAPNTTVNTVDMRDVRKIFDAELPINT